MLREDPLPPEAVDPCRPPVGVLARTLCVIPLVLFQRHVNALHAKLGHAAHGDPRFTWMDAAVVAGSLAFGVALAALEGKPWWAMW